MFYRTEAALILILILIWILTASAEWVQISPDFSASANEVEFKVLSSDGNRIEIEFKLLGFQLENVTFEGENFHRLSILHSGDLGEIGKPELPAISRFLAMPSTVGARLKVEEVETWEQSGIRLAPLQPPALENSPQTPEFVCQREFYAQDQFYPAQRVRIGKPVIMRDMRLLPLDFFPFEYNPATGCLRAIKRMKLTINFEGAGENPKKRNFKHPSSSFKPLYQNSVLNYSESDLDDYPAPKGGYLIISAPDLQDELQPLIDWKREKGHFVQWADLSLIGNSFNNIKNYIQNAYNTWEEPPEFVLLVGDATGAYPLAAEYYTGDITDHKYSMLEGNDYLPDVQVGRIAISTTMQLRVIVNKIINYESNPSFVHPDWFKRGLMIACTSTITCKHTKQWIKQKMLDNNFAFVDTVWYMSSVNTYQVTQSVNNGVAWVNYRGWAGWGGWGNSQTYALQNGFMLPVVTGMVCNTADFEETECLAEAWIRTGTLSNPNGGIAATGPSSLYTHTKWNNCIDMGFYAGAFDQGATTATGALNAGKMEMWLDFPNNRGPGSTSNSVECYFHEYNMLGDPGLEMWTYVPEALSAQFASQIPLGTNNLQVLVTDPNSQDPVPESYACLTQNGQVLAWGYTDDDGIANLAPAPFTAGQLKLTITKHNFIPYRGVINALQAPVFVGSVGYIVDDDNNGLSSGNGDGIINPGETIELGVQLSDFGTDTAFAVSSTIAADDPYLSILQNSAFFGDIAPGDSNWSSNSYLFSISPFAQDGHSFQFNVNAVSGAGDSCQSLMIIPVGGPHLSLDCYYQSPNINNYQPGDTVELAVRLSNQGFIPSGDLNLTLTSDHPWLEILNPNSNIHSIAPGDTANNSSTPFIIATAPEIVPCAPLDFALLLTNSSGYSQGLELSVQFGRGDVNDPVGPDQYGYFAFGMEDSSYTQCPVYQWANIATTGTIVPLSEGSEEGDFEFVNLPFPFRFYGQEYNQVAVSSEGWLSFDNNPVISTYNYAIPSSLGPDAMIAPFWDDLEIDYGEVRTQYFPTYNIFVIEWFEVEVVTTNSLNTFEVLLYDPTAYPTPTGDGQIRFQYLVYNNNDSQDNYNTIGIEAPGNSTGIQYTFANINNSRAGALSANKAITFTTLYENSNQSPIIFATSPAPFDSLEVGQSVTFKADAYDYEGDDLTFSWFHGNQSAGDQEICTLNFALSGEDTVKVVVSDGQNETEYTWNFMVWTPVSVEAPTSLPLNFRLGPIAPNPFNPVLNINFEIAQAGRVKIAIYDLLGREVERLVNGQFQPGRYSVRWNGDRCSSGLYFIQMQTQNFTAVKKALLLK